MSETENLVNENSGTLGAEKVAISDKMLGNNDDTSGMLIQSLGISGPDTIPHYEAVRESGRWHSRNRKGLVALGARLLEAIAFDAIERNRRIIVLASRSPHREDAATLARLLGATQVWEGAKPFSLGRIQELMAEKLSPASPGTETTVFLETTDQTCLTQGLGIGAQLQRGQRNEDEIGRMEQFLAEHDSWLIVLFDLGGQALLPTIASAIPGCYVFPWILGWFQDIDRVSGVAADAFERLQPRLLGACNVALPPKRSVELQLFSELTELSRSAPAFGLDKLIDRIETALANAASDSDDRRRAAESRLDQLFEERLNAASKGEIGRTLFTVSLLTERERYDSIVWLASELLPDGEAPIDLLPTSMLAAWQREVDDSERLMGRRPSLPDWRTVFLHDPDSTLLACGLRGEAGQIKRDSVFQQIDALTVLQQRRRVFLQTLLNRIGERRLYAHVPSEHVECLVRCHVQLARALGEVNDAQTILAFCGMKPGETDLPLPPAARLLASEMVNGLPDLAYVTWVVTLADLGPLIAELAASPMEKTRIVAAELSRLENKWRLEAASNLGTSLMKLQAIFVAQSSPEDILDTWIVALARIIPYQSFWLLLAWLTLGRTTPSPKAFGLAILESLKTPSRESRPQRISELKSVWEILFQSIRKYIQEGAALDALPPIEIWPDGLNALHADTYEARRWPWFPSLANYADDFFSNYEIRWNFRLEESREIEPSIMASRLFQNKGGEESRLFLARLLCRRPDDWLRAMDNFSHAMTEDGAAQSRFHTDQHVQQRLLDVFAMLVGGTDRKASDHYASADVSLRLQTLAWRTISEHLATTAFDNAHRGAALAVASCRADEQRRRVEDMEILRLYPSAVLAEWRFMTFGPGPVNRDTKEYDMLLQVLLQARAAARDQGAALSISSCFVALAEAQTVLSNYFADHAFAQTAATYARKAETLRAMAAFFAPAVRTGQPLKALSPPLLIVPPLSPPGHRHNP